MKQPALADRPEYSFVIPIYDRVVPVYEAIASCLNQTYSNFEIIAVLDGSPSETREVVAEFKDPRLRTFSYAQSFGTACRARNRGIFEARGKYICMLDSDDISSPRRLQYVSDLRSRLGYDPDVIYGAVSFLPEVNRIEGISFGQKASPTPGGFTLDSLLSTNQIYTLSASIKRSALLRYGGFRVELKYREDYELWLRLKYHNCSFEYTDEILSIYRIHDSNNELNFKADDSRYYAESLQLYRTPFVNWGLS